ncbi:MAG: SDR family NAD(P)-dependent oxidoreductase [Gammaproteobacteria bacterium]|jgi:3alpha(or 20beta)-hydroxysteroid dehydrogenase
MMDSTRFKDRVFLISGAARGIGRALATRVVAEGGKVLIGDLRHEVGKALATELGPNAQYQPLDVTQESDWLEAVAHAERLGPLSGLVNNAGIYFPKTMLAPDSVNDFANHVAVNQTGVFLGMRSVVPAFERSGEGSIVNMSSTVGLRSAPNAFAYTATKWAVRGMTKAAALELADRNIRVNSVHPGPIDTDLIKIRGEAHNQARAAQIPMQRMGTAQEVANLVCFLLSDESRYMTGSELAIDGGAAM